MEGCYAVMHMASPIPNTMAKEIPEDEIVIPAMEGTVRVLKAASETPSVKKVIVTSSFAAIFGEDIFDQ